MAQIGQFVPDPGPSGGPVALTRQRRHTPRAGRRRAEWPHPGNIASSHLLVGESAAWLSGCIQSEIHLIGALLRTKLRTGISCFSCGKSAAFRCRDENRNCGELLPESIANCLHRFLVHCAHLTRKDARHMELLDK